MSRAVRSSPTRRCRTAMSIASRDESSPLTARRGCGPSRDVTRDCTSVMSGRRPSRVTVTHVPDMGTGCLEMNRPLASATSTMPSSQRSKQPISSTGPNRFFTARSSRSREPRSPSKCSTTSTMCSRARGPAIEPSFVTWPTRRVGRCRDFATLTSAAVTARTWVTPPAAPSTSPLAIVWIESITSRSGSTASMWLSTAARSVSAARYRWSSRAPVRSARSRTWAADSSPDT